MKVLTVLGSPRPKGNSSTLAKYLNDNLEKNGAHVETYILNKLNYKGCQSCYACKVKSEKCVVKDDISPILDAMHESDVIVMASPNYYGHISGQLKMFLDRTFSILTPEFEMGPNRSRLKPGKYFIFIFTQGADETMFGDVIGKMEQMKDYYQFEGVHTIRGCQLADAKDASQRPDLLEQVRQVADLLSAKFKLVQ